MSDLVPFVLCAREKQRHGDRSYPSEIHGYDDYYPARDTEGRRKSSCEPDCTGRAQHLKYPVRQRYIAGDHQKKEHNEGNKEANSHDCRRFPYRVRRKTPSADDSLVPFPDIRNCVENDREEGHRLDASRSPDGRAAYEHQYIAESTGAFTQALLRHRREARRSERHGLEYTVEYLLSDGHISDRKRIRVFRREYYRRAAEDQYERENKYEPCMLAEPPVYLPRRKTPLYAFFKTAENVEPDYISKPAEHYHQHRREHHEYIAVIADQTVRPYYVYPRVAERRY